MLDDYPGTVLVVSHDRDFVDRVATMTVAMEGDGKATVYAGGWSDYRAQRGGDDPHVAEQKQKKLPPKNQNSGILENRNSGKVAQKPGLSFTEKHRLEALPAEIERLEAEIAKLTELLSDPELFAREPVKFRKATEALTTRQKALSDAEEEWLQLEEKASG